MRAGTSLRLDMDMRDKSEVLKVGLETLAVPFAATVVNDSRFVSSYVITSCG